MILENKPPSTEEWLRKMYYGTHIQWNITQPGKGQIVSFAETWMDQDTVTERSKSEREK